MLIEMLINKNMGALFKTFKIHVLTSRRMITAVMKISFYFNSKYFPGVRLLLAPLGGLLLRRSHRFVFLQSHLCRSSAPLFISTI